MMIPGKEGVELVGFRRMKENEYFIDSLGYIYKYTPGYKFTDALVVKPADGYEFKEVSGDIAAVKVPEKKTYVVIKFEKPEDFKKVNYVNFSKTGIYSYGILYQKDSPIMSVTEVTE